VLVSLLSSFLYRADAKGNGDTIVNAGSLQVRDKKGKPNGECPLKHTDVKAEISGFLSRVTVTQEFTNPFPEKIEAVYTFPLPQAAAVDDMTMIIGERKIKGPIMRREEAQATYDAAKQLGKTASLLDQERPNIFTQAVANFMPGQEIHITISYVETLAYEDGSYEWSFPMVVGQRYIPISDQQSDSSRITPPTAQGMRAGHDLSLEIKLNAGVPIQALNSETHETEIERTADNSAVVRLKDRATIPNKDFVLKYQVAGNAIDDALLSHRTERGGFFTLSYSHPSALHRKT
jgi:Ca-activated chloride channel family protein